MKTGSRHTFKLLILFLFIVPNIQAQVTIGSNEPASKAALLQLKDTKGVTGGGANSSKGLGLPRVKLTDLDNLYPMFTEDDGITPTAEYIAGKNTLDMEHIGLVVYHPEKCTLFGRGVYVWTGNQWKKTNAEIPVGVTLNPNTILLHIPSGRDLRSLNSSTPVILDVTVGPAGNQATITHNVGIGYAPSWTPLDLIPFTQNPLPASIGSTQLRLLPDPMNTTTEVTPTDPWFSKETKLTFTSECGTADILLNQTNYALKLSSTTRDTLITFHGINQGHALNVQTNSRWKVNVSDPQQILVSSTPANDVIRGADKHDGKLNGGESFRIEAKPGGKGVRFFTAQGIISDPNIPKRFEDIRVTFKQCQGTEDLTAIEAQGYDIEYRANKVIRHKDTRGPNGDYDFYSADFDIAGRWMITNLSAVRYDTQRSDGSSYSTLASINIHNDYNDGLSVTRASWGYPNKTGTDDASDDILYKYNPHFGLLYTWAAATGNRQTTVVEMNQPYPSDGGSQVKVQGMCPYGWHIPSDWEWNRLEMEIINNSTKYSEFTQNIKDMPGVIPYDPTVIYTERGSLQGNAMKDGCEPIKAGDDLSFYGKSKKVIDGGFSILMAGNASPSNQTAHVGKAINFGHVGSYTTSSSNGTYCIKRSFSTGKKTGITPSAHRYMLSSLRCVKD